MQMRNQRYNEYLLGKREWSTVYQPLPAPHALLNPSPHTDNHYTDHKL
jgi:hypothetical protein